jgi:WD40 repeat protein
MIDGSDLSFRGGTIMCRSFVLTCVALLGSQAFLYAQEAPAVRRIGEAPWRHAGCSMVAYTPRGDRLITAGGGFRVWDTATGRILHDIPADPIHIHKLAVVGPEGKQLATLGHTDATVRLWDLTTGKEIAKHKHQRFEPSSMAVSADGKLLALGNWNLDVILFQLPSFKVLHTFRGLPEDALPQDKVNQQVQVSRIVSGLAFSPNGRYLAVAATNGGNWVYEVRSKKLLHKWRKFSYAGTVAFAPDSKLWLSGYQNRKDPDRNTVDYWTLYQAIDLARGGETLDIKTKGPFYPLAFSPDGQLVGFVPFQGEFGIWSVAEKRTVFHYKSLGDPHVDLAFSPDGKTLAVASAGLRMFDTRTWRDLRTPEGHVSGIVAAQFTPDGANIITASYDTTTRLWDARTGKERHRFEGHIRNIESMSLSGDGRMAATGDSFGWIHLWDLAAKKQVARFKHTDLYYSAYGLGFSPDGTQLAVTGTSLTANIFDVKTQKIVRSLRGYDGLESVGQWDLCWSPDGRMLAGIGGNYDSVYLWDPTRGRLRARTAPVKGRIFGFSFSPDAEVLAYWADNKVHVLRLKDYKVVREFPKVRFGPTAFSPNGRWLVAGGKLWDEATGKELYDFRRDFASVHFDRESRRLVTVGRYETFVEVWDLGRLPFARK